MATKTQAQIDAAQEAADYKAVLADLRKQLQISTLQKQIREKDMWLPTGQSASDTDIFQTLKKNNEALMTVLNKADTPMYVQQTAATPGDSGGPNYLMYAGIGLVAFFLLRKFKIF